jgi:hypothetical protein
MKKSASVDKEMRVVGYSNSNLIRESLNYKDNDISHGIVNVKDIIRSTSVKPDFNEARQEQWKVIPSPLKYTKGK